MEEFTILHYLFLGLAALLSGYLVRQTIGRDKVEYFFLVFFLMTGNFNEALTFKIPGVSFFEVQPIRFLFFLLSFYLIRQFLFHRERFSTQFRQQKKIPFFLVFLFLNLLFITGSLVKNSAAIGWSEVIVYVVYLLNFVIIVYSFQLLISKQGIDVLGKAIIIGAVISCCISYVQFVGDPTFMRIGDFRGAFGSFLRANGLFKTEYFNGYFIIAAIIWILATFQNRWFKYVLIAFLCTGVILTFQRMSWLVLGLIFGVYFLFYERPSFSTLSILSIGSLIMLVLTVLIYYSAIMNSSVVKERLSDSVDGRKGYYSMVFQNIGKRPFLGYGNQKNDVYYRSMMQITQSRERATGEEGDIHSGYFQTLFFYGIPALLCFVVFVVACIYYFGQLSRIHLFFAVPFLFAIVFLCSNLTNTLLYSKCIAILFAIHIGIGWKARYLSDYFPITDLDKFVR